MSSAAHRFGRVTNFEHRIFVVGYSRQVQWKKSKQIPIQNLTRLQVDVLPRSKDSYPKFGRTFSFSLTRKLFRLCCGLKIISKRNVELLKEYKKMFSSTFQ
jgi:hypothetical protein